MLSLIQAAMRGRMPVWRLRRPARLFSTSQTKRSSTVELPDLDLYQRQNALTTTKIKRNVELVPGRVSAEPFIYMTSDVRFANALQPTVDSSHVYDIASLGSSSPVKRSLFEHFKNL